MFHACLRDSSLQVIVTTVRTCVPRGDAYDVVLDDTVLFAEGGGQPSDTGWLVQGDGCGGVLRRRVRQVLRDESGNFLHVADGPLVPSSEGGAAVEARVDWDRRFDHMQQHTGQHLLTAVAQDRFGWATTAFHLGVELSDVELAVSAISQSGIEALEVAINQEILAARPVRVSEVEAASALADPTVRTRGLPEGHHGAVRIVEIEGIDRNTCGGTHLWSTSALGALKLLGTEALRGGTRLRFAAGGRVLSLLGQALSREDTLARVLSCPPVEFSSAVTRLLDQARGAEKALRSLRDELASALGAEIGASSERLVALHRDDADFAFLNAVASAALRRREGMLLLLTAGDPAGEGIFLLAGPAEIVGAQGPLVAEHLGGRGGGARGRYQGKCHLGRLPEAIALLRAAEP
jgi:misacylated tRNA(Ala) deacylase